MNSENITQQNTGQEYSRRREGQVINLQPTDFYDIVLNSIVHNDKLIVLAHNFPISFY